MLENKITVYQSLAKSLREHNVDTMFGLMGDANLFMINDYVRNLGGEFIPAVHEGSTVLMAIAYAQITGKVGVATVTHGPAFTNCMTALVEGKRTNAPIVLIAGDTPESNPHHVQSIAQREVAAAAGVEFVQIRSPETATADLAQAFYQAQNLNCPIVLNAPVNFMWEEVEHNPVFFKPVEDQSHVPEGEVFDDAVGMIASAKRPLILAGFGAKDATNEIIALADRLEAPLATTLKARSLFKGHDYCIDICGTLSTPGGYDAMAQADCIVCFGASLNNFTTDHGKLFKDKRIIQIDNRADAIGTFLHPNAALIADAALTAVKISNLLEEAEIPPSGFTRELDSATLSKHVSSPKKNSANGTVNYVNALCMMNEKLPQNRMVVTDGGRFMTEVWCRVAVPNADSYVDTVSFGSIGLGLQTAIGACVANRKQPVVLFTGDGGFMMGGLTEFNTAVREKLDLIVIICNDAAYGAEHIQFLDKDMDPGLSTFNWPSFAEVANALGANGFSVRTNEELKAAMEAIKDRNGPILIDLHLDPFDVPRMRI